MVAALLLAAAAAFPAPGTYSYNAAMSGQPVGHWAVTITADGDSTMIDENSTATVMGIALGATATLALDADLSPQSYVGRYRTPGQTVAADVAVTGTTATVSSSVVGAPKQPALMAGTTHFILVEPGLLAGLFALPAQLSAWKAPHVTWITPSTGQAQLLTASTGDPTAASARPAGVPATDTVISIAAPIAVTIWYDPATLVPDRIDVPSQNAVLTRAP